MNPWRILLLMLGMLWPCWCLISHLTRLYQRAHFWYFGTTGSWDTSINYWWIDKCGSSVIDRGQTNNSLGARPQYSRYLFNPQLVSSLQIQPNHSYYSLPLMAALYYQPFQQFSSYPTPNILIAVITTIGTVYQIVSLLQEDLELHTNNPLGWLRILIRRVTMG